MPEYYISSQIPQPEIDPVTVAIKRNPATESAPQPGGPPNPTPAPQPPQQPAPQPKPQ